MIWVDLFFVVVVALLFSIILAVPLRWRHPRRSEGGWLAAVFLFMLFLFGVWAIGAWASPVGPPLWGRAWLPFVVAGVVIALIVAAVSPANPRPDLATEPRDAASSAVVTVFGILFWLTVIVMLGLAIAGYVWHAP
jgi:hypothetical protein